MGTMNSFMASRAPAGAAGQECGVIAPADKQLARRELLLEVTLQTEVLVALREQFLIHAAMRRVAGGATLANCLMLENERPALGNMAFRARLHFRGQGEPAALDRVALVRVVAIAARDFALQNRMMMRQVETAFHIQVALKTCFRRFAGVQNGIAGAAGF